MVQKPGDTLFGEFLIEKGLVDELAVLEALNYQREHTVPIGQIALKSRKLTVKQVFTILNTQVDNNKLFGVIAVELGYISQEDIDELLDLQSSQRPRLGEILVNMGKIDKTALEILHTDFQKRRNNF